MGRSDLQAPAIIVYCERSAGVIAAKSMKDGWQAFTWFLNTHVHVFPFTAIT